MIFIDQAFVNGAAGAVINESQIEKVAKDAADSSKAVIAVSDTVWALQELAAFHRQEIYNLSLCCNRHKWQDHNKGDDCKDTQPEVIYC